METGAFVAGVDGCRAGWVMVTVPAVGAGAPHVEVVPDAGPIVERVAQGVLAAVAIDIPMGLPADAPRAVDSEARGDSGAQRRDPS